MFADLFDEGDDVAGQEIKATDCAIKLPKPPAARGNGGFVGLQNQGSTCYMNALLQVMYMTPELRTGLFAVDPNELGYAEVKEAELVAPAAHEAGSSASAPSLLEVDESLLQSLMDMGFDEQGSRRTLLATTGKGGLEAALSYYLEHSEDKGFLDPLEGVVPKQCSAGSATITSGVSSGASKKKKRPRLIPLELQRLFAQLQCLDVYAQSTTDLTSKGFQWQGMDGRVQHDAHELNRLLLDALEKSLKHTSGDNLCKSLYCGELVNRIQCLRCGTMRDRKEEYFDLMTQVLGCPDMAASMRTYLAAELLEGDNAYACEVCGVKCPAHKGTVILEPLPPILSFSLQRFDIDRRSWERVKVKSPFEFPLLMDIGQFVEKGKAAGGVCPALNQLNSPIANDPETEAALLREVRNSMLWLGEAVGRAMRAATDIINRNKPLVFREATGDVAALAVRIMASLDPTELNSIHQDLLGKFCTASDTHSLYDLFAVITHCGSAYSGHYFAYIRDCFGSGKWEMPKAKENKGEAVAEASTDPEKTKTSTVVQDQFRERSRAELAAYCDATICRFVINSDSPLGLLVRIILEEGAELAKEYYQTNEQKNARPTYMPIGRIGAAVKKHIKRSWKDSFVVGMTEFVKNFPDDLISYLSAKESFVVWDATQIQFLDAGSFVTSAVHRAQSERTIEPPYTLLNDEELAAELQRQLNGDATTNLEKGEQDAGEGWEVVGDKKAVLVKDESEKTSVVDSEIMKAARAAQQIEKESTAALIDEVGNRLLNSVFGEFWEFNDSSVVPICLSRLARAFESTNSGYILVYRERRADCSTVAPHIRTPNVPQPWAEVVRAENAFLSEKRAEYDEHVQAANAGTVDLCVRCPAHVQLDVVGEALLTPRLASTKDGNPLRWSEGFYVRCANNTTLTELKEFIATQLLLSPIENDYGVSLVPDGRGRNVDVKSTSEWGNNSTLLDKLAAVGKNISLPEPGAATLSVLSRRGEGASWYPTDALEVVAARNEKLNVRRGVGIEAKEPLSYENTTLGAVAQSLTGSTAQALDKLMYPSEISSENGHITVLSSDTDAGNIQNNPPARTVAMNVLLWNDNKIDGSLVKSGASHEPRLFVIKLLAPPLTDTLHDLSVARPAVIWDREIWVNASMNVAALCEHVLKWAQQVVATEPNKLKQHFVGSPPTSSLSVHVIETYGTLKNHAKAHAKGIYAKLLYDGDTASVVRAVKKDSTARDLQGSELLIEFAAPGKQKHQSGLSLSEIEVTFRNNEIEVTYEFDDKLQKAISRWPATEEADIKKDLSVVPVTTKATVDHTQTLADLKRKMLLHLCMRSLPRLQASPDGDGEDIGTIGTSGLNLCISELIDRVRLKINPDLAGIMSDGDIDEKKAASVVLKLGDVLYLEMGEPKALGSITLQCVPVFGNDVATKRNPKLPGFKANHLKIEQTFPVTKDSTVSVEDVRLSFLREMNYLIAAELVKGESSEITLLDESFTRLRSTNWAEEAAEMPLGELVSAARTPLLLSSVVSSGLLKSNSLLLLEMGKPPVPGMIDLELFIDVRQMALMTNLVLSEGQVEGAADGHAPSFDFKAYIGMLSCDLDMPMLELQERALRLCQEVLPTIFLRRIEKVYGPVQSTISDKEDQVFDFTVYGAALPDSIESFVLRELRDDLDGLPGRCLWIRGGPLVPALMHSAVSTETIRESAVQQNGSANSHSSKENNSRRRGNGKKKETFAGSLLATPVASSAPTTVTKSSIRRAKLASGSRRLIIQVLPQGSLHSTSIGGEGAMKLWIYRGVPAASSIIYQGRAIDNILSPRLHCPEGTPVDVNFNAGPIPSLPQLKRAIERDLQIPFHNQRIFKLFCAENTWKDLEAMAEKRKKTSKGIDNLISVPYLLKEGDSLCVLDTGGTHGSGPIAFGSLLAAQITTSQYYVDRPVDESRRQLAAEGATTDKSKKKKRDQVEVGLRLAGDFDFSDDDES